MCGHCGCGTTEHHHHEHNHDHHHEHDKFIQIEQDIMAENQYYADHNREFLTSQNITCYNLVSSPGSGKTTLLVETINALKSDFNIAVIEGDQQTDRDKQRIAATGANVIQLNTGKSCHLDAHNVGHAIDDIKPENNSLLFIENVGNLVCPALFDLGEKCKVVILSVTEGDDKPIKYPHMFAESSLMIINKIDLLPYVNFDVNQCIQYAKQVNPNIEVIQLSATTKQGFETWLKWLS